MPYQVLARRWRPQRFDDVVGQPSVTRTLRNALSSGRIAQAFVFAGPRGVGKTTTARILARALNCVNGPTPDPCGVCDACVEIAEGRDMDVLEIDAATHTGIDNVREVIISGLAIVPVRDRYKVFVIDEVHQLSQPSFNALLKSIEEPPPHVIFMMATTEIGKIPDTVLSRSQVFEFKTIPATAIVTQLRTIAEADTIVVPDEALRLIARSAEGSMRDAQSAFDQVMAFAGETITVEDVSTVLGLVGRDLVLDIATAVADESAPAAFELTAKSIELGHDLRVVCRELSRLVRDLLVISVDPSRADDPEVAPEGERARLIELAARFSREDLLRAFDVLTRAEFEIRNAAQPRYHMEMALLRWIHLRKLLPIEQVIEGLERGGARPSPSPAPARPPAPPVRQVTQPAPAAARPITPAAPRVSAPSPARVTQPTAPPARPVERVAAVAPPPVPVPTPASASSPGDEDLAGFKAAFLTEVQKTKPSFHGMVVAMAQRIDAAADRLTFSFLPNHRTLREKLDQNRPWLEALAAQVTGRPIRIIAVQSDDVKSTDVKSGNVKSTNVKSNNEATPALVTAPSAPAPPVDASKPADLRAAALADPGVQAMLEMFPAEIRDVEEL